MEEKIGKQPFKNLLKLNFGIERVKNGKQIIIIIY